MMVFNKFYCKPFLVGEFSDKKLFGQIKAQVPKDKTVKIYHPFISQHNFDIVMRMLERQKHIDTEIEWLYVKLRKPLDLAIRKMGASTDDELKHTEHALGLGYALRNEGFKVQYENFLDSREEWAKEAREYMKTHGPQKFRENVHTLKTFASYAEQVARPPEKDEIKLVIPGKELYNEVANVMLRYHEKIAHTGEKCTKGDMCRHLAVRYS